MTEPGARRYCPPDEVRLLARRAIQVSGIVQGVGFRPFVYALAARYGLSGFVRNQQGRVEIEAEGPAPALAAFTEALRAEAPPLARVEGLSWAPLPPRGEPGFRIEASGRAGAPEVYLAPDAATCADCLRELLDPADRRYRYPFLNCTACGPRLTIITGAPYDRASTTLAGFALCAACEAEYLDPADRRFHAQPVACPACGPRLALLDAAGAPLPCPDPVAELARRLAEGAVAAIKGLGGYHLACNARSAEAVAALRARKHREEKPFAVMVADTDAALGLGELGEAELALLQSPARPVVLARARPGGPLAAAVAPGSPLLGLMLPYTPLHHLLLRDAGGPLVMTSANRSDEPIAYQDGPALQQLRGLADLFLTHDRPIHTRCDDSVARVVDGAPLPLRRSRGYAPAPLRLGRPLRAPTLALGAQLKGAFALGRADRALPSHHLGDLDHYEAFRAFGEAVAHYERLFGVRPERLVHDLHPDYASTRYALERAAREGLELLAVQHHHAHLAACLADAGHDGPAIGVVFDGAGLGSDGTIWGGELLLGDAASVERAGHLATVGMPGGGAAAREPWRMALAHALAAGLDLGPLERRAGAERVRLARQMLARGLNCPLTSSAGRLFDAAAWLAGAADAVSFEGQAAMALEALAARSDDPGAYPLALREGLVLDPAPLLRALAGDVEAGAERARIARRFHAGLAEGVLRACLALRDRSGVAAVALSGGVFVNAVLAGETGRRLRAAGFRVLRHRQVPPNDGGLCLGQLAVAAARDARG